MALILANVYKKKEFTLQNGTLIIPSGALAYLPAYKYQFLIETTFMNTVYKAIVSVIVSNSASVPFTTLK